MPTAKCFKDTAASGTTAKLSWGPVRPPKPELQMEGRQSLARPIGDEVIDPKTYDVHGGWFDAGDLKKYTSNTVNVQNMLLMAYEMAMVKGGPKDNDLNIPELGNKIPDELDEIRVGTEFLIRDNDGTGAAFGRVHQESGSPPETVTLPVQLTMPNSEVTMGRAAALAYAAAVWSESKFDNAFATKCLNEAMRSCKLLQLKPHPWPVDPKNPNKILSQGELRGDNDYPTCAPSRPPPCSASRARKNSTKSCMPISPTATWSGTPLIRRCGSISTAKAPTRPSSPKSRKRCSPPPIPP